MQRCPPHRIRCGQQLVRLSEWTGIRQNLVPGKKGKPKLHTELYNLRDDLSQSKDVSADHPEVVARIEQIFREQHMPSAAFPIPILDGGIIMLLFIEGLMRRDISIQIKERIYQAAFVFLLLFAAMVIYNDIAKSLPGLSKLLP